VRGLQLHPKTPRKLPQGSGGEQRDQFTFNDFLLLFGGQLQGDKRWIQQAELIQWDDLEDDDAIQIDAIIDARAQDGSWRTEKMFQSILRLLAGQS